MRKRFILRFVFVNIVLIINISSKNSNLNLFGYPLNSPIGVSACPLTTSAGIKALSKIGYDIITYKTIRSSYCPAFSEDIYYVDARDNITRKDIYTKFNSLENRQNYLDKLDRLDKIAITNSFGINSLDQEDTIKDISQARQELTDRQVLIVSIYGFGQTKEEQIEDFVKAAKIAVAGGAQIVEANLSCPNIKQELIYKNPELVYEICKAINKEIQEIPLIIKVGVFDSFEQTRSIILAAHSGGCRGICGINTVPVEVVDSENKPVYGVDRKFSGISGSPINSLALEFVKDVRKIIDEEKLDLTLFATGGVVNPEDFDNFLAAGADIVLCATGAMQDINLAKDYHKKHTPDCNLHKKELIKKLNQIGAIKIENIKLKSGLLSPIYFDMRLIISHPKLLEEIATEVKNKIVSSKFDTLCGVPYAAVPLTSLVSNLTNIPMIMLRKEVKSYGTKKLIEGEFKPDNICLVIEDVIVSGSSILETVKTLEDHQIVVKDIVILVDRNQGGVENIQKRGYNVHAIFNISEILQVLLSENFISHKQFATIMQFCADTKTEL